MFHVVELLCTRRGPHVAVLALISVGFAGCSADMSTRLSEDSFSNPFASQPEATASVPAPVERRDQFVPHLVGRLAPDVIAFQQHLSAAAGAHHAVTKLVEAGVVARAHENKNRQDYDGQLHAAL